MLIKISFRLTSRRLPKSLRETLQNMGDMVHNVKKEEDGAASRCGKAVLEERKRLERGREYLFRYWVCLSYEQFLGSVESGERGLSVESSYGPMLVGILREKELRPFAEGKSKWVLVDRSYVSDGCIWVLLLKSGSIIDDCFSAMKNCRRAANKIRVSRTEGLQRHERRAYGSH